MPVESFSTSAEALMVVMERPGGPWATLFPLNLDVGLVLDEQLAPLLGGRRRTPVDQSKTSSPPVRRPVAFHVYDLRLKLSQELAAFLCADNKSRLGDVCVSVCAPPAVGAKDG